jgi:uncharacterized protein (TIGR02117 family)
MLLIFFAVVTGLVASYFAALAILGLVPVNSDFRPTPDGVRIYVINNGVHSDIVLPARSDIIDWTQQFPVSEFRNLPSPLPYIAFGWGDRGFYLDIPTWSDLTFKVAVVALSGVDATLMHVQYLTDPSRAPDSIALDISAGQHEMLVRHIRDTFLRTTDGELKLVVGRSYFDTDAFYEAKGRFSLFVTCNEWVRRGLAKAGIRTALWSPSMRPLFWQLRAYR